MRQVADNIWIVDGAGSVTGGLRLPIRMTVIRLADQTLLLHSPIQYSAELQGALEAIGKVRYFVAPSIAHWMFIPGWQRAIPDALTYVVPGLERRNGPRSAGLKVDGLLAEEPAPEWARDMEVILLTAPYFAEAALFHTPSRTLVLTDLVQNLDPARLSPLARGFARLLGISAPDGKAPAYLRTLLRLGGRSTEQAAARILSLNPDRVIFAHGQWFETDATEQLRRALRWLTRKPLPRESSSRRPDLAGMRVVITGASSGIGRAAALAFARRGAQLVLAARREQVLDKLAAECERLGGHALVVPTDVTDSHAVQQLAARAEQRFGGIDVWINNAGTGVFGAYQQADMALHRRTIEVNLLGAMHGAFAALPVFLRQGRGMLINNISLGGWAPTPFAASYTASKFGLRGFTASLRQELASHRDIHVCAVFPAMVDTPGFVHGANVSGRRLDPGPFLYQPEDVAETFVKLTRHPRAEIAVGWPARAGQLSYSIAPRPTEYLVSKVFRLLLSRSNAAPVSTGTLLEPASVGTTASGGWLNRKRLPPATQINRLGALLGVAAAAMVGVAVWRSQRHGRGRPHSTRNAARFDAS